MQLLIFLQFFYPLYLQQIDYLSILTHKYDYFKVSVISLWIQ